MTLGGHRMFKLATQCFIAHDCDEAPFDPRYREASLLQHLLEIPGLASGQ